VIAVAATRVPPYDSARRLVDYTGRFAELSSERTIAVTPDRAKAVPEAALAGELIGLA
jgi:hypothetical protein